MGQWDVIIESQTYICFNSDYISQMIRFPHLFSCVGFRFSQISKMLLSKNTKFLQTVTNQSVIMTPRIYAVASRIFAAQLRRKNTPINFIYVEQFCNKLEAIHYKFLSIQESLAILYFVRMYYGEFSKIDNKLQKLTVGVLKHCGQLLLQLKPRFTLFVDYIVELNFYSKNIANPDTPNQFPQTKKQIYSYIHNQPTPSKQQKVDLIYHINRIILESIQEDNLEQIHQLVLLKSIKQIEGMINFFSIGILYKNINTIIGCLHRITNKQTKDFVLSFFNRLVERFVVMIDEDILVITEEREMQTAINNRNQLRSIITKNHGKEELPMQLAIVINRLYQVYLKNKK